MNKRRMGRILGDALRTGWEDLKRIWAAAAVFVLYFLIGKRYLHTLCPCVMVTGFPCPACGLTRAAFCVLRGRYRDAWYLHPFIYAILVWTVLFAVRRYLLQKETKSLKKWAAFVLVGMILFYGYRMMRYFPGESPMTYYYGSIGFRLWNRLKGLLY